jgi:hypothetical protein
MEEKSVSTQASHVLTSNTRAVDTALLGQSAQPPLAHAHAQQANTPVHVFLLPPAATTTGRAGRSPARLACSHYNLPANKRSP